MKVKEWCFIYKCYFGQFECSYTKSGEKGRIKIQFQKKQRGADCRDSRADKTEHVPILPSSNSRPNSTYPRGVLGEIQQQTSRHDVGAPKAVCNEINWPRAHPNRLPPAILPFCPSCLLWQNSSPSLNLQQIPRINRLSTPPTINLRRFRDKPFTGAASPPPPLWSVRCHAWSKQDAGEL